MKEKTIYAGGNVVNYSSEGQLTADTLEKQVEVLKKALFHTKTIEKENTGS